jgi:hypothetical protein
MCRAFHTIGAAASERMQLRLHVCRILRNPAVRFFGFGAEDIITLRGSGGVVLEIALDESPIR